ncbi:MULTISPECIES: hypothetical protein [Methylobacterium]|uniref:hypothetical protein n=1 Tax=Methylobacterium TaxID=407 RepID=UPI0013ED2F08|nr:hypothetical protein [Methylobacterium sp. DB0501]NGM34140.1 hypothetical protein [Methylobacterium sp. DB0501]
MDVTSKDKVAMTAAPHQSDWNVPLAMPRGCAVIVPHYVFVSVVVAQVQCDRLYRV